MIKLIASDLDGTLLQNGAQALTPRAIDLISRLCDAGIHFVSASGRQYDNQKTCLCTFKGPYFIYRREWLNLHASGKSHFPCYDQR
mgnify:FL=1